LQQLRVSAGGNIGRGLRAQWRSSRPRRVGTEEFEAVHIDGSQLLTQDLMQKILGTWDNDQLFVIVDHQGNKSLDAAAYYLGHGMPNVHALRGGIDAWSLEVDSTVRRYTLN
jgi:rhodanese-related sulfurtransferase